MSVENKLQKNQKRSGFQWIESYLFDQLLFECSDPGVKPLEDFQL